MFRLFLMCLLTELLIASSVSHAQQSGPMPALNGLDPVELAHGKEKAGRADLQLVLGQYHYLFATKQNQAAFEKDPRRYAIQMAGACARMGPLSGAGSANRYFVFDNRIYVFASDICRDNFKKNPAQHVDGPDAPPEGNKEAKEAGLRLVKLALKGIGGVDKLDAVKNVQFTLPRAYGAGKERVEGELTMTLAFPDQLRTDETWGKWAGGHALAGNQSFQRSSKGDRMLEESEREYLTREFFRHPIAILKAHKRADFVAIVAGNGKVADRDVERVTVAVAGATSTLSIDPETGQVLAIAYRGRPGIGPIGAIERTFADFKLVDGVTLPHAVHMTWEGKASPTYSGTYSAVRVSAVLGADFFRASPGK